MLTHCDKILQDALALPDEERAMVVVGLIESLDETTDTDVDEAWAVEIERRCAALDAGDSETSDWKDVRRRIEADILRK